jgi:hypothetical protein
VKDMIDLDAIPSTYDEAVRPLAAWHQEDGIAIYYLPDVDKATVRLVEVSAEFGDDDNLRPVSMGASSKFPFRSSVLLVSNADWKRVNSGENSLPDGWDLSDLIKL